MTVSSFSRDVPVQSLQRYLQRYLQSCRRLPRTLCALVFSLLVSSLAVQGQNPLGLRRLSHAEVVDLVSDATVVFAANGALVHEYHGPFVDGLSQTAYRDWDQRIVEGRLRLQDDQPGMVCYAYADNQDNCAYFTIDEISGRIYLDFVTTVQPQTVKVLGGDRMNLVSRIEVPYVDPLDSDSLDSDPLDGDPLDGEAR